MGRFRVWARAAGAAAIVAMATGLHAAPCTQPPLNCQEPDQLGHGADSTVGVASDANPESGRAVRDNLDIAPGTINTVCWWGFYLDFNASADCGPGGVPDAFTVTYYANEPGFPGAPGSVFAGPFDVTPTLAKAATGNVIPSVVGDLAEYEYTATHPDVTVADESCLWIEIRNDTTGSDPTCIWLWSTAPSQSEGGLGDAVSWQDNTVNDFDLAFCVNVELGDPSLCALPINPGCDGAVNPCDEVSPAPGCMDEECCTLVCEDLPFCCVVDWNQQCVDLAGVLCTECGKPGTGGCYVANFTPYCDDTCNGDDCIGCCQAVCAVDPFCCGEGGGSPPPSWDGFCAFEATQLCGCLAGEEPPNDECVNAIPIGLGDTPLDNHCATAGPPEHETCTDSYLVGLGLDVWYTYTAGFTGPLVVSTCDQVDYNTQLAVYDGCDCDNLSDPPLACNNDGAVCSDGSSLLVVDVVAGHCYTIRVGSSFDGPIGTGTLTLSADVPEPCDIGPLVPPGAIEEPEACGDDANGGCNADPPAYTPVQMGDAVHGTAWAQTGQRDTDWYELVVGEPTEVTLTVVAEFPVGVGFIETEPPGSGDCADATGNVAPAASAAACVETFVTAVLEPGTWWPWVAPNIGDGVPCGGGATGNEYLLTISTGAPCLWDCQDAPDGAVGVADFLALLAQWGQVATSCDVASPAGVGVEDFLDLLAHWGACP
jgi:hypothetical protein